MSKMLALNVRIGGSLREFVAQAVGDSGDYDNASEYVRDLIRKETSSEKIRSAQNRQLLQPRRWPCSRLLLFPEVPIEKSAWMRSLIVISLKRS